MKKHKPLAIFDIDGTIFRSSLLIELTKHLVRSDVFPGRAYSELKSKKLRWLDRKGSYGDYIAKVVDVYQKYLRGVEERELKKIAKHIITEQKNRVYVYSRNLLKRIKKSHTLVAISGSPLTIVQEFKKAWKFDDIFGTQYEITRSRFTGRVLFVPSRNKKEVLKKYCKEHDIALKNSVGVGDTESDISFLSMVEDPIAFNPNAKLLRAAKLRKWKIIVERKDVIYHL